MPARSDAALRSPRRIDIPSRIMRYPLDSLENTTLEKLFAAEVGASRLGKVFIRCSCKSVQVRP
jgi:hypothetical protein